MIYLLDEAGGQKLVYLFSNRLPPAVVEAAKSLLDRPGAGFDVQGVLGDHPWDARHVRGFPHKHIEVRAEEVDERVFLFGGELGADA